MFISRSLISAVTVATVAMLTAGGVWATEEEGEGVTMEFVRIPAGEFMMGSPVGESGRSNNEEQRHQVKITEPFYMSITEVTQQQYIQIMWHNPSVFKDAGNPAERMSWGGAMEFCRRLSKKTGKEITLPTEAQWEYACRAGTDTRFSFGEDNQSLESYCWYKANSNQQSHPVATKKPNAWGLYDMHGNVQEWCSDRFDDPYYSRSLSIDPEGPSILRVVRGGSHAHTGDFCRSASRRGSSSDNRSGVIGFRVVFPGKDGNGKNVMRIALATEANKKVITLEKGSEDQPRGWRMINGAVRDEAGTAVDSAEMRILPIRHWNLSRYDGVRFEAEWQPRDSSTLTDKYYFVARHRKRNLAAVVEIDKNTDTLDVILRPGGILTGKVVNSAGKGIEKAVVVMKLKGSNGMEVHTGFFARTDAEGKFDIRAVPLGLGYILTARSRGYGMTHTEVDSGDVRDNRIDAGSIVLVRGQFTISGTVVDVNDKPVADVGVCCYGEGQPGSSSVTDANGKFTLDGVFKGQVKVMAGGYRLYGYADAEAGATNVKVVLDNKGVSPPKGRACFPADTDVWANGALVQISKVVRGQTVGKLGCTALTAPFGQIERLKEHVGSFECRDIVLENGNRISVVDAHCFMLDSGQWIAAQDLRNGLRLKTLNGKVGIKSVTTRPTPFVGKVYNLKVKSSDHYMVGKDGVIVRDY